MTSLLDTYKINNFVIKFDQKDWEWKAINQFGFCIDSDDIFLKLKSRIESIK